MGANRVAPVPHHHADPEHEHGDEEDEEHLLHDANEAIGRSAEPQPASPPSLRRWASHASGIDTTITKVAITFTNGTLFGRLKLE